LTKKSFLRVKKQYEARQLFVFKTPNKSLFFALQKQKKPHAKGEKKSPKKALRSSAKKEK